MSSINPDPAKRAGAAQRDAAKANGNSLYFMANAPFEPASGPDFVSKVAVFAILYIPKWEKSNPFLDFF